METGKANPDSEVSANVYLSPGRIAAPAIQQVEAGFKGTALASAKGARTAGAATRLFLLVDVGFLVKESMHLHDGAKAASETLRQRASELERKLEEPPRSTGVCKRSPLHHPQRVRVQRHIQGPGAGGTFSGKKGVRQTCWS